MHQQTCPLTHVRSDANEHPMHGNEQTHNHTTTHTYTHPPVKCISINFFVCCMRSIPNENCLRIDHSCQSLSLFTHISPECSQCIFLFLPPIVSLRLVFFVFCQQQSTEMYTYIVIRLILARQMQQQSIYDGYVANMGYSNNKDAIECIPRGATTMR